MNNRGLNGLKRRIKMASKIKSTKSNLKHTQKNRELNNYMLIMGKVIDHILANQLIEVSNEFIYIEEIRANYNKLKQAIRQNRENKS